MKAIAYILIVSLALMGLDRFVHGMENPNPLAEASCLLDCCSSDSDCGDDQENDKHKPEHQCPADCDCGCCFHFTAIQFQFMSLAGTEVQSYHYGTFRDNYHFDFLFPHFQPPRFS